MWARYDGCFRAASFTFSGRYSYRFERREWPDSEHHCLRRFRSRLPDLARSTGLVERHRYRRFGGDPTVRGTNWRTKSQHRGGFSENRDDYRGLNRFAFPGAKSAATDDRDSCSQPYVRVVGHGNEADRGEKETPRPSERQYRLPHILEGQASRNAGASSGGDRPQGSADHVMVLSGRKTPQSWSLTRSRPLSFARVTFANGRERFVVWFDNGFMLLERPEKR